MWSVCTCGVCTCGVCVHVECVYMWSVCTCGVCVHVECVYMWSVCTCEVCVHVGVCEEGLAGPGITASFGVGVVTEHADPRFDRAMTLRTLMAMEGRPVLWMWS